MQFQRSLLNTFAIGGVKAALILIVGSGIAMAQDTSGEIGVSLNVLPPINGCAIDQDQVDLATTSFEVQSGQIISAAINFEINCSGTVTAPAMVEIILGGGVRPSDGNATLEGPNGAYIGYTLLISGTHTISGAAGETIDITSMLGTPSGGQLLINIQSLVDFDNLDADISQLGTYTATSVIAVTY